MTADIYRMAFTDDPHCGVIPDKTKEANHAGDSDSSRAKGSKTTGNTFRVQCCECGKKFRTASWIPYCPKCGSSDVELAETFVARGAFLVREREAQ